MAGVAFNAPAQESLPSIMASIDRALATLPKSTNGAIVALANQDGANAAIVAKVKGGFEVQAWVGKTWSKPGVEYGAAIRKVW